MIILAALQLLDKSYCIIITLHDAARDVGTYSL